MHPSGKPELAPRRRSNRVFVEIPVEVFGTELTGIDFFEQAITNSVSRNGASVVLHRTLGPGQEITIKRKGGPEVLASIVGQISTSRDGFTYCIAFVGSHDTFWDIDFQEPDAAAIGKVLLECMGCHRREEAGLDEIELAVFEINGRLHRNCKSCRASTVWSTLASGKPVAEPSPTENHAAPQLEPPGSPEMPVQRRKKSRTRMEKLACIRQLQHQEVVQTIDLSRSGLRFRSHRVYKPGDWVEIAVPYVQNGANIFTSGRIVWIKIVAGHQEYGVVYRQSGAA